MLSYLLKLETIMQAPGILKTAFIVTATAFASAALQAAAPISGRWMTQDRDAIIEIAPCGATVCGRIARFLVTPPEGAGQKDVNNPNKALRTRTILGMNILTNFKADGDKWRGKIYDPKSGKTYRSFVYKGVSGNLIVKGCVGPFCKSQTWTKAA
jgi:uncharacterized protein (DUF2147 family)